MGKKPAPKYGEGRREFHTHMKIVIFSWICLYVVLDVEKRLRRDLKRTKTLLHDSQTMLAKQKESAGNRTTVKQLKNKVTSAVHSYTRFVCWQFSLTSFGITSQFAHPLFCCGHPSKWSIRFWVCIVIFLQDIQGYNRLNFTCPVTIFDWLDYFKVFLCLTLPHFSAIWAGYN